MLAANFPLVIISAGRSTCPTGNNCLVQSWRESEDSFFASALSLVPQPCPLTDRGPIAAQRADPLSRTPSMPDALSIASARRSSALQEHSLILSPKKELPGSSHFGRVPLPPLICGLSKITTAPSHPTPSLRFRVCAGNSLCLARQPRDPLLSPLLEWANLFFTSL
jgi:hypothetical protein